LESVAAINEKIAESGKAAAAAMGTGGTGLASSVDDAGKKGGGAAAKLTDLQKVMQKLREEAEKLRATMGMTDLQAEIWEQQKAAGVAADSANGQQISGLVTQIDKMKELKDATEEWRDTIGSAFSDFITKGGSFKAVLGEIIAKLAEMLASSAFEAIWNASGGGGFVSDILSGLGLGANANGTRDWRGGLTRVNERGGEIMNLPKGTQIIPADVSRRMADRSGGGSSVNLQVVPSPLFDVVMREEATGVMQQGLAQARRQEPDRIAGYTRDRRRRY
jgi:phage-related protein